MESLLTIVLSTLNVITTILHTIGCYLLTHQYTNGLQNSQQLFLINLSVSEGFLNLLQFLTNNYSVTGTHPSLVEVQHYVKTVRGYGFAVVYFTTMIYLTMDKLFDVLLNIRYLLYWNELRTRSLLLGTWCLSLMSALGASITYYFTHFDVHEKLDLYVYPTLNTIFIVTALLTYGFIFRKYKQTRIPPVPLPVSEESRFYIPVLLISTYIVFMCIPSFTQTIHVALGYKHDYDVIINNVLRILWSMSYLSDAIIYIFLRKSVRRLLQAKFGCFFVRRSSRQIAPVATIVMNKSSL